MKRVIFILMTLFTVIPSSSQETEEQKDARRRLFIEDFLATYEAAYEKKEIDYISDFFSGDALVITETKKLNHFGKEIAPSVSKSRPYETVVENRKEYIDRLRKVFDSNASIQLSIAGKRIRRHARYAEIYGVNFSQLWKDRNGGDNLESQMPGFVFLMIDFKHGEQTPVIHVRTWQPEDNIEKESDKYFLRDFMVYETK